MSTSATCVVTRCNAGCGWVGARLGHGRNLVLESSAGGKAVLRDHGVGGGCQARLAELCVGWGGHPWREAAGRDAEGWGDVISGEGSETRHAAGPCRQHWRLSVPTASGATQVDADALRPSASAEEQAAKGSCLGLTARKLPGRHEDTGMLVLPTDSGDFRFSPWDSKRGPHEQTCARRALLSCCASCTGRLHAVKYSWAEIRSAVAGAPSRPTAVAAAAGKGQDVCGWQQQGQP